MMIDPKWHLTPGPSAPLKVWSDYGPEDKKA